jgi:hypothetical protein
MRKGKKLIADINTYYTRVPVGSENLLWKYEIAFKSNKVWKDEADALKAAQRICRKLGFEVINR